MFTKPWGGVQGPSLHAESHESYMGYADEKSASLAKDRYK